MRICDDDDDLRAAMSAVSGSVLVDRFVENAIEIDVDALCDGDGRLHRRGDAARRGGGRPLRRLVLRPAGAVAHARERARGRARRQAARARARRRRPAQRPARDRRLDGLRARGEPARVAHGAVREQGDRRQPRRGRVPARRTARSSPTSGCTPPRPDRGERQGGGAPVRPLPRRRSGARAGDALDGRGDGDRLRPADRVREGRARGRPAAADRPGTAFLSVRDGDKPSIAPIAAALAGLGFELVATSGTARTLRAAGLEVEEVGKVADAEPGEPTVVDLIREHRCDLVVNTPQGSGARADGYLIREAALVARVPCITTDLRRGRGRPRDRERARRGDALAPGAHRGLRVRRRPLGRDRAHASGSRWSATSAVGPYSLVRLGRGGLEPGAPGQFFMLEAPGRVAAATVQPLPRAARRARLPHRPDRARNARDLRARARGRDQGHGPLGNGFDLDVERPLLVGGGIGIAPFPYLSERLGGPPAILGFRTARHAEAAALVPNAEVVLEPTLVTDALPDDPGDVLACGPEPMLEALARARARRPARLGGADGVRLRRVLRLRRRGRDGYRAAVRRRARPSRGPGSGSERRGHPHPQRVRLPRRPDRARRRAHARRLRDEDDHAAAPRGQPARPDRRDRPRDAQLDRPAGPGHRRVRRAITLPRLAELGVAALGLGRRVLGAPTTPASARGSTGDERVVGDRAQPLVPERRGGARDGGRDRRGGRARDRRSRSTRSSRPAQWDIAASARAVVAAGADGLSLVNTIRGLALDPGTLRPRLARGVGGYSGPALKPIALACVYACATRRRRPDRRHGRCLARGSTRSSSSRRGERGRARHRPLRGPGCAGTGSGASSRRRPRPVGSPIRLDAREVPAVVGSRKSLQTSENGTA